MVLRKIYGHKRDKVKREWDRLRRVELYDLYARSVIWVIK